MSSERTFGEESIYHIRVRGTLDKRRADWFDGFVIASRADGETLLTGPVVDQAALHGVLSRIRDLGLPLLFALRTDCPCPKTSCARHGRCQECAAYHGAKGKLSYCLRKRTKWDRRCAVFTGTK